MVRFSPTVSARAVAVRRRTGGGRHGPEKGSRPLDRLDARVATARPVAPDTACCVSRDDT